MAFIEDGSRNFIVIAGWGNNEVAIVDIDDNFRMRKISLSNNPESTATGQRNVEWAVGTNYVWIDGPEAAEIYIVEVGATIDSSRVSTVIPDVPGGFIVHVDNYMRRGDISASSGTTNAASRDATVDNNDDKTKALAVVALIMGAVALVAIALVAILSLSGSRVGSNSKEEGSTTGRVSLGSKQAV